MPKITKIKKSLGTLSSGNEVFIEAVQINSGQPGPRIYIQAAIHGWETVGIMVCWQLIKFFSKNLLQGIITIVPIANPWGVDAKIGNKQVSYINLNGDEFGNWNCIFTKKIIQETQNLSREMILAKTLQQLASGHNIAIDLHTAWDCIEHVYYFSHQKQAVKWFGVSDCIELPYKFTGTFDESFLYPFKDKTKMSFTVEFNQNSPADAGKIINFINGQKLPGKFCFWKENDLKFLYASAGGIIEYLVKPGEIITKDQLIGKIIGSGKPQTIKSSWSAKVCYLGTNTAVDTGQRIGALLIIQKWGKMK